MTPSGYPHNYAEFTGSYAIKSGPGHKSFTDSPVAVSGTIPSWTKIDRVQGSSNSAPPWTSAYTLLHISDSEISCHPCTGTVPAASGAVFEDIISIIEGAQTWHLSPFRISHHGEVSTYSYS